METKWKHIMELNVQNATNFMKANNTKNQGNATQNTRMLLQMYV